MSAAGIAVALGLGAVALLGGSRRRARRDTCAATPTVAARWPRARLREWVDCAPRTAAEIADIQARLRTAGRNADADYVGTRWAARRRVEDAPPDGRLNPTEQQQATAAVTSPTPPAAVPTAPAGHPTGTGTRGRGTPDRGRQSSGPTITVPTPGAGRRGAAAGQGSGPVTTLPDPHGTVTFPTADDVTREDAPATTAPHGGTRGRDEVRPEVAAGEGARDPDAARSLVSRLVPRLRERRNYHNLLADFQYAAGLRSDGIYGGLSENAIRYYGGDPPAAFRPPLATAPEANYVDRIIAPPAVSGADPLVGFLPPPADAVGGMMGPPAPIPHGVADIQIEDRAAGFGGAAADPNVPSYSGG